MNIEITTEEKLKIATDALEAIIAISYASDKPDYFSEALFEASKVRDMRMHAKEALTFSKSDL